MLKRFLRPAPGKQQTLVTACRVTTNLVRMNHAVRCPSRPAQEPSTRPAAAKVLPEAQKEYTSPYASIRSDLDYDYHTPPTPERCQVQDELIRATLQRHAAATAAYPVKQHKRPLLLFTAGAMGAGKSHFLSTLPFSYVLIDPDELMSKLPRYARPCAPGSTFGQGSALLQELEQSTRLRHEARLITEVILLAAMQQGADIVTDGSLRSYTWYLAQIPMLRRRFPQYRVEVVHIHCPLQEVLKRAQKRSLRTGREVPPALIERSWKDSRRAISVLGRQKLVDRVRMVDSTGPLPRVVYDSLEDEAWPLRGVPNEISRVDGFVNSAGVVMENGDDRLQTKVKAKL
ncbi:zeta toxin-domain-containing protein [Protomyces lactucae-debilis]|uniref:Zeta toxin-domain-containing protein n=1 Tax=Protomyces lactucae-debilis TaxID=2754530 RepID=A0A1Y2FK41_PROLT|nr:zeta toxin-domain-containing protein [Protomyces lactucae-debilis]ORY83155.1 zeta toxin-domain-containing protein [Protomyces lactucae-debilis]